MGGGTRGRGRRRDVNRASPYLIYYYVVQEFDFLYFPILEKREKKKFLFRTLWSVYIM